MAYRLLEQLEEQVTLMEFKSVRDFRHEDISKELKYWGSKEMDYINPKDGFHWLYYQGELVLFSTANEVYSQVASSDKWKDVVARKMDVQAAIKATKKEGKDLWNQLGGLVDFKDKTITISKEDANNKKRMRVIYDIKAFQKALKELKRYGVDESFKIKGTGKPLLSETVGEILKMKDYVDLIFKEEHPILYHGTSKKRWEESISKQGLQPGKFDEAYNDLIKGYSEKNVYLAADEKTAEFYGKRQAKKDDDTHYVVIQVKVPDKAKFLPDDAFAWYLVSKGGNDVQMASSTKEGVKTNGSVAYKGSIKPQFLKLVSTKKA